MVLWARRKERSRHNERIPVDNCDTMSSVRGARTPNKYPKKRPFHEDHLETDRDAPRRPRRKCLDVGNTEKLSTGP